MNNKRYFTQTSISANNLPCNITVKRTPKHLVFTPSTTLGDQLSFFFAYSNKRCSFVAIQPLKQSRLRKQQPGKVENGKRSIHKWAKSSSQLRRNHQMSSLQSDRIVTGALGGVGDTLPVGH